jgi:hypothetical protein
MKDTNSKKYNDALDKVFGITEESQCLQCKCKLKGTSEVAFIHGKGMMCNECWKKVKYIK